VCGGHNIRLLSGSPPLRRAYNTINDDKDSKLPWERNESASGTASSKSTWRYGSGATDGGESLTKKHVEIDPVAEGRPPRLWYRPPTHRLRQHNLQERQRKPRAVQLLSMRRPRPSSLRHRIFRQARQTERHSTKPGRDRRVQHQHRI
jgi:hypothetical protein